MNESRLDELRYLENYRFILGNSSVYSTVMLEKEKHFL